MARKLWDRSGVVKPLRLGTAALRRNGRCGIPFEPPGKAILRSVPMSKTNAPPQIRDLLASPEPPELGPGPRSGVLSVDALNQQFDNSPHAMSLSGNTRELAHALVLLWHDHLDAAHTIAQSIESADGSYVHGLMHRREPDYGNAKYWFHRIGPHPCFAELAAQAATLLRARNDRVLEAKLIPRGRWDPFAFIDACENAAVRPAADESVQTLRAVQAIEFEVLLQHFSPP